MTLMDFFESNKNVIFTYILPFSKTKALIETTFFSSEIDYKEDLQGASFNIKNPNAQSTCGCGSSFSVPDDIGQ